jgi:hypothetical protein
MPVRHKPTPVYTKIRHIDERNLLVIAENSAEMSELRIAGNRTVTVAVAGAQKPIITPVVNRDILRDNRKLRRIYFAATPLDYAPVPAQ